MNRFQCLFSGSQKYVYKNCDCAATASDFFNTTLSAHWIEKDVLTQFSQSPPLTIVEETRRQYLEEGMGVSEAVSGEY